MAATNLGWRGAARDDPEVVALRERLVAENGIRDLEMVEPGDIERAVRLFRRDGFVLVANVLDRGQQDRLGEASFRAIDEIVALHDEARTGNRGSHRYSFGGGPASPVRFCTCRSGRCSSTCLRSRRS